MTSKVLVPTMLIAFLVINGRQAIRADQPNDQSAPALSAQSNTAPPATAPSPPPPAQKLTLRDKLFHWPALIHSKPPCANCNLTDPDFCCSTCRSEWIFLFGSCRAFYGEPRSHQPLVYVPGP